MFLVGTLYAVSGSTPVRIRDLASALAEDDGVIARFGPELQVLDLTIQLLAKLDQRRLT